MSNYLYAANMTHAHEPWATDAGNCTSECPICRVADEIEALRKALKEIVSLTDRHHSKVPHYNKFLFIAQKALNNEQGQ